MSIIKPTLKSEIFPIIVLSATVLLSLYFYANFPELVATHWNFEGQIDNYNSKFVGAFTIPLLIIGLYIMFLVLPYVDPKKDRYQEFAKTYHIFKGLIIGFMSIIYVTASLVNLGYPIPIDLVVPTLIGILFIVMGNYMGKIKHNWFMGIRTPWTLSSENVWNKTHRVSGWLFIGLGTVMLTTPLLPKAIITPFFFSAIIITVIGSMAYSYFLYHKENK